MDTIFINNVKKGAKVVFKDGRVGEVTDNKQGIIRQVKVKNPFGSFDIGDDYAYKWKTAEIDGVIYRCVMTPKQEQQAQLVETSRRTIGW